MSAGLIARCAGATDIGAGLIWKEAPDGEGGDEARA
jgi:hypothetical protein